MGEFIKRRSRKAGLPPGSLIHIGEKKREEVKITVINYDEDSFLEKELSAVAECFPYHGQPGVLWINVEGVHRIEILEKLGNCFGIHPLVLEDIANTDQRPKIEDLGDYICAILKMISHNDESGDIVTEQISLILGQNFVISFQEGLEGDVFNPVRDRLRGGKGKIRKMGADHLAYSLLDTIVDNYFVVLERLGESIESIEEEMVQDPTTQTLQVLHHMKREMIFLRKSVWPLREVISSLTKGESALVRNTTIIYLRDVYDHTIQVIDTVETFRDILSGMLDIYLSSISNRLNSIMKVLTIIATIFMPLTFLAGVYGMNFKFMPELEWRWGYPAVWGVMLVVGISMLVFFRRKKWL